MKKFFGALFGIALSLTLSNPIYSETTYTASEVAKHNTTSSCWMSFENSVYDLTNYLRQHDRYMDIDSWCGKDMTQDFKDKAGMGVDHKISSYYLLENYRIGSLTSSNNASSNSSDSNTNITSGDDVTSTTSSTSDTSEHDELYSVEIEGQEMKALSIKQIAQLWGIDDNVLLQEIINEFDLNGSYNVDSILEELRDEYKFSPALIKDIAESIKNGQVDSIIDMEDSINTINSASTERNNPYDFWFPFLASITLYLASYIFMNSELGKNYLTRKTFNAIWNTVLVISLIPSALFGFYLIFRYSIPELAKINFDFTYWHVEGSIVFATITIAHLIQRFQLYKMQLTPQKKSKP